MWILTKKLHTSAYAQDTKELGLDLEAFCQTCEKSLTWRGKDSLSRTWLQRWKRESWIQHLSSRTLRPSHTESFVDAWTSSLEDSRVSHSQLLESVKLLKTPDTSSPTSQTESESANLELFSSKTYKESSVARQPTENQFSSMSSEHWKDWVIEQRQEYSQRKKSAHLIRESESTSLGWPTARTSDAEGGRIETEMTDQGFKSKRHKSNQTFGAKLRDAVETHEEQKNWQTPTTMDIERTPEGMEKRKAYRESIGRKYVEGCLTEQVKNWSTPTVMDTANIQKPRKKNPSGGQKPPLCQEVKNWPTATTRDWKDTNATVPPSRANPSKQTLGQRVAHVGHPDQANPNTIGKSQGLQGKLNPNWVEHLMGLPAGWTDLGYWGTE